MAKVREAKDQNKKSIWLIECPACGDLHQLDERWSFNGDLEKPTFSPSLLLRSGHYAPHFTSKDNCWCKYNAEQIAKGESLSGFSCTICHSFITDGKIQFLSDCTHGLAGKTVELPDYDAY